MKRCARQQASRLLPAQVVVAEVEVRDADVAVDQAGQGCSRACLTRFFQFRCNRTNPSGSVCPTPKTSKMQILQQRTQFSICLSQSPPSLIVGGKALLFLSAAKTGTHIAPFGPPFRRAAPTPYMGYLGVLTDTSKAVAGQAQRF